MLGHFGKNQYKRNIYTFFFFFFFFNVNQALSPYFPKVYILNPIENAYYHVYNELWTDLGDLLILRKHAVWNCL